MDWFYGRSQQVPEEKSVDNANLDDISRKLEESQIDINRSINLLKRDNFLDYAEQFSIRTDWVRHAESCANVATGLNVIKSSTYYNPTLTFTGMQQSIRLGYKYIRERYDNYDIIFTSPSFRTIMTALLSLRGTDAVIYVVPYISEIRNIAGYIGADSQNAPVDIDILKRGVLFFKDWMQKNWVKNFDDVELIKILVDLKKKYTVKYDDVFKKRYDFAADKYNNIVLLIDKINEFTGIGKNGPFYEKVSNIDIDEHLFLLIDQLNSVNDEESAEKLSNFRTNNIKYLRGPTVDFSYYQYFIDKARFNSDIEELNIQDPSFDKFYINVIPKVIFDKFKDKKSKQLNILCYSHGALIRGEIFKMCGERIKHMSNTEVWSITRPIISDPGRNSCIKQYAPNEALNKYDKEADSIISKKFNNNICRSESIKGIINWPIWYNNPQQTKTQHEYMGNLPYIGSLIKSYTSEETDPDSQFYDRDPLKYHEKNIPDSFKGGREQYYRHKYLKYKNKYLNQLKY